MSASERASGGLPTLRGAPHALPSLVPGDGTSLQHLPRSLPRGHPPKQLRKWSMETSSLHPCSWVRAGVGRLGTAPQSRAERLLPPPSPSPSLSRLPGPLPGRSTYLWGIKAALKTARVPQSHQKVPESLTRWFREALPTNTISKP